MFSTPVNGFFNSNDNMSRNHPDTKGYIPLSCFNCLCFFWNYSELFYILNPGDDDDHRR